MSKCSYYFKTYIFSQICTNFIHSYSLYFYLQLRAVQVVDLTQESDEEMLYVSQIRTTPPPPRQPPPPQLGPPPLIRLRLPSCRYQPPPPVSPPDPQPAQSTLNFNSYIPAQCIHAPPATWLPPVPHTFTPAPPPPPMGEFLFVDT